MFNSKYDFQGIKKLGAAGLRSVLASSPKLAWLLKFKSIDLFFEFIANYLANKGLILLNVPAILVETEWDQKQMDAAMDRALSQITAKGGRDKLSVQEKKAIDDEVIKAARKFIVIGKS